MEAYIIHKKQATRINIINIKRISSQKETLSGGYKWIGKLLDWVHLLI